VNAWKIKCVESKSVSYARYYAMSPTCSKFTGGYPQTKIDKHHVASLNIAHAECGSN